MGTRFAQSQFAFCGAVLRGVRPVAGWPAGSKKNPEPLVDTDTLAVSIETDELERVLNKLLTSPDNTIKLTLMIEKK